MRAVCLPGSRGSPAFFFARGGMLQSLGCSTAQWPADGRRRHGNVQRLVGGAGGGRVEGAPELRWIEQGRAASDREAKLPARRVRRKEAWQERCRQADTGRGRRRHARLSWQAGAAAHCVARLGLFCANAPARRLRARAYGRHGPWAVWDHARLPPQRMGAAPGACWPTLRAWHARHRAHAKPFRNLGGPVEMPQGQGTAPVLLPVPGPRSFPKTPRLGPEWLDPGRAGRVPCTARAGRAAQKKKGLLGIAGGSRGPGMRA